MELNCAAARRIRTTGVALEDDAADWLDSHVVYFASVDYIRCSARITITPKTAIITKPSGS
jgi:hypothetical protein